MKEAVDREDGEEDGMMAATDRSFFDGYLDAWNAHDPAAVAGYMADDAFVIGTNDREVQGVPATGRSFCVRGASVGKLDASGRIVENRDYYNLADLFAQLGIFPTAPSPPA